MPKDTKPEQLSTLLREYIKDLKGVTVYVDGSREGQILNKISEKDTRKFLAGNKTTDGADLETVKCITGKCEV